MTRRLRRMAEITRLNTAIIMAARWECPAYISHHPTVEAREKRP
ncbi:MAG: hypothetical protein OXB98_06475 [Bryobacterales bacterium]|nr:hypothetical protein [Bryobacterales bacterium]